MGNAVFNLHGALANRENIDQVLAGLSASYGADFYIYGALFEISSIPYIITNYPEKWWAHYQANNYLKIDPIPKEIARRSTPFTWEGLLLKCPQEKRVMDEAATFGLKYGITCPVHFLGTAGLSFASSKPISRDHHHNIMMSALYVHQSVIDSFKKDILSARQIEIVRLLYIGNTRPQIASILNISENTVKTHCANIYRKLNASDKMDAIRKAKLLGLLPAI